MTTNNNQNKPNSGILFQNKDKKNPNQPDFTGKYYDKNNKEWRVAGWERDKDGNKFISLAFSDPDDFKKGQNNAVNTTNNNAPAQKQTTQNNQNASSNNNFNETDNDFGSLFDEIG